MTEQQNNSQSYREYLIKALKNIGRTRKVKFEANRDFALIQCFNPQHKGGQEAKPSFRINLVKHGRYRAGSGKCYTCGYFAGSFKRILEGIKRPDLVVNESSLDADEYIEIKRVEGLDNSLLGEDAITFNQTGDSIPWPQHQPWRSIRGDLVTKIGGRLYFDEDLETQMLYLPCIVNGREVGGIRANIVKQGKSNYYNTRGGWTKATGLFPYDYTASLLQETGMDTIILGEGPRDALNPLQHGIPALSILGSENWTDLKAELILSLPIKRIILAFDPDEAGDRALKKTYRSLKDEIDVSRFDLSKYQPEDQSDPIDLGNMPTPVISRLKNLSVRTAHV